MTTLYARHRKLRGRAVEAAQLIAEGELGVAAIAERLGVDRRSLARWMKIPEFVGEVESIVEERRKEIRRLGLAVLERRVAALDKRWRALHRVIEERAADPDMADVPGGTTGLLVKRTKRVEVTGGGEDGPRSTTVHDYEVDTALLKTILEHEKQAAQELGQWVEKGAQEISGPGGGAIPFEAMVEKVYGEASAEKGG